jgi:hypothetical protein
MINFNLEQIEDPMDRENAEKLATEFKSNPFLNGSLKHFSLTIDQAETGYRFKHNLGFRPYDVFLTYISDGSAVVINYDAIDDTYISFDFPSACVVRFFAGFVR